LCPPVHPDRRAGPEDQRRIRRAVIAIGRHRRGAAGLSRSIRGRSRNESSARTLAADRPGAARAAAWPLVRRKRKIATAARWWRGCDSVKNVRARPWLPMAWISTLVAGAEVV